MHKHCGKVKLAAGSSGIETLTFGSVDADTTRSATDPEKLAYNIIWAFQFKISATQ